MMKKEADRDSKTVCREYYSSYERQSNVDNLPRSGRPKLLKGTACIND